MIFLNTTFNQNENEILCNYINKFKIEVGVLLSIDDDKLSGIDNPNRIISVGGLYLAEEKDELQSWYMGQEIKGNYDFWGNYGSLKDALDSL